MLYKEYIKIKALSVHRIGNKAAVEGVELSDSTVELDEMLGEILKSYFLMAFKDEERYRFGHPADKDLNAVFSFLSEVFTNEGTFHEQSKNIAKYLYEQSVHPNIKRGDLYVVYFKDCILDGETVDAIGLFKSENKDTYIRINQVAGGFSVESQTGMNINKLDKGCLVFNKNKDNGYVACVVDNANRSDAKYWVNNFLQLKRCEDDFRQTEQVVAMCKSFITKLPEDYDKATKAVMMNKVIETLGESSVSIGAIAENAFEPVGASNAFMNFVNNFQAKNEMTFRESFQGKKECISKRRVRTATKIRLDDNFEVIILGGDENIEKGFNENRRQKYYTFFFDREK